MRFLRSRVGLGVAGMLLVGLVGASIAVLTSSHTTPSATVRTTSQPTATATTAPSPSPTSTLAPVRHELPAPTATPAPPPESTPTVMPSAGQPIDLHGTVGTVTSGNNTFTLKTSTNGTVTVQVTSTTTFQIQGKTSTFQNLRSGMAAQVTGNFELDGTFVALSVDAQTDN